MSAGEPILMLRTMTCCASAKVLCLDGALTTRSLDEIGDPLLECRSLMEKFIDVAARIGYLARPTAPLTVREHRNMAYHIVTTATISWALRWVHLGAASVSTMHANVAPISVGLKAKTG